MPLVFLVTRMKPERCIDLADVHQSDPLVAQLMAEERNIVVKLTLFWAIVSVGRCSGPPRMIIRLIPFFLVEAFS